MTKSKLTKRFPKAVFFILGNEFCERFCYYGMRAVLTLYFTDVLHMSEDKATVVYHIFTMLCYFTPVFGAIIADGWIGKFNTILNLSIVYVLGNIVLSSASVTSLGWHQAVSFVGLLLIACGTGGIKPCVSAFGGDQFEASQESDRKLFFSIFYFAINAGSLISSFVTPILRSDVHCFGALTCYPLAFGVPALLMITALLLFVIGKVYYQIVPATGSILTKVMKCIGHALYRKVVSKNEKRDHWLEFADDKFDSKLIKEVQCVLNMMFLFIPLPIFWALFDQQGSRWTLQATYMDGHLVNNYTLKPDQIQTVNPLLILVMIPLFESAIYPWLGKCNLLTKSLQRMFIGGVLAALAFVIAGFIQLQIEAGLPKIPASNSSEFTFINAMPCSLNLTINNGKEAIFNLKPNEASFVIPSNVDMEALVMLNRCPENFVHSKSFNFKVENQKAFTVSILPMLVTSTVSKNIEPFVVQVYQQRKKPEHGEADVRFIYNPDEDFSNVTIKLSKENGFISIPLEEFDNKAWVGNYRLVSPGVYNIKAHLVNGNKDLIKNLNVTIFPNGGGVYTYVLSEHVINKTSIVAVEEVKENTLHMLWQVPQYTVITMGEIMFSITGLEFSYAQAPISMKSVLSAAWLLTTAFGNLIVVIIAELKFFEKQSYEFFLFAALMMLVMFLFGLMSMSYKYVDPSKDFEDEEMKGKGVLNPAFDKES